MKKQKASECQNCKYWIRGIACDAPKKVKNNCSENMTKEGKLKASEVWGEIKRTCNYCGEQLDSYGSIDIVCVNPACPTFALLQIPAEQMPVKRRKK